MKFLDLIPISLTEEEIKNKKFFGQLMDKWKTENPDIKDEEGKVLYNVFLGIQNGLRPDVPAVYSFLSRYSGRYINHPYFDPKDLKQIGKYSYKQLLYLLNSYGKINDKIINTGNDVWNFDIKQPKSFKPDENKIEASKNLWYGSEYLIFQNEGLRVYKIPNELTAIKFGYYYHQIYTNNTGIKYGSPQNFHVWCVTWREDFGTNQWFRYRPVGTFHFIIDESKPDNGWNYNGTEKYYFGALQKTVNGGFMLTSGLNDDDKPMSWDQVERIYPLLRGKKEIFVSTPYDEKNELLNKNQKGMVNEDPNSDHYFPIQDYETKLTYVSNAASFLTLPDSWKSMNYHLRKEYIMKTETQYLHNRFSNLLFIKEIKKVGSEYKLLDTRVKELGYKEGVSRIILNLLSVEYGIEEKPKRRSKDNKQLAILESRATKKCGIFDFTKNDWVEKDGIKYDGGFTYVKKLDTFFYDENDNSYYVETYEDKTQNVKFYAVYENEVGPDAHFISQKKWDELKLIFDEKTFSGKKPDPETDVDIKEYTH